MLFTIDGLIRIVIKKESRWTAFPPVTESACISHQLEGIVAQDLCGNSGRTLFQRRIKAAVVPFLFLASTAIVKENSIYNPIKKCHATASYPWLPTVPISIIALLVETATNLEFRRQQDAAAAWPVILDANLDLAIS